MTFDEWFDSEYHGSYGGENGMRALLKEAWDAASSRLPEGADSSFRRGLHEAKIACMGTIIGTNKEDHPTDRAHDRAVEGCVAAIARLESPQVEQP